MEKLRRAGYSEEAIRAYRLTGSRSAALACMTRREGEWDLGLGRSGSVNTPGGYGILLDAKNGRARVVLEKENEEAKEAVKASKRKPLMAPSRDYPVTKVSPRGAKL